MAGGDRRDETWLSGQVDVVRAGGDAGGHHRQAMTHVGADGGHQHPAAAGHRRQRGGVVDAGDDDADRGHVEAVVREPGADGLELVPAAPGDRQLEPGRRMASGLCDVAGEVSSDQAAGEAGGAEHDDVPGAGHRGCHGRDLGSCGGVGHGAAG
jgi:hypothetical protein